MNSLSLSLVYVVPLALLALMLSRPRAPARWAVILLLASLPLFYVAHYLLLQQLPGWPSDDTVPAEFELLAFDISEPDPASAYRGEILMWVRSGHDATPRVHRLEYRKSLHQALSNAGEMQAAGRPQVGHRVTAGTKPADAGGSERPGESIRFSDAERRGLPAKDGG